MNSPDRQPKYWTLSGWGITRPARFRPRFLRVSLIGLSRMKLKKWCTGTLMRASWRFSRKRWDTIMFYLPKYRMANIVLRKPSHRKSRFKIIWVRGGAHYTLCFFFHEYMKTNNREKKKRKLKRRKKREKKRKEKRKKNM